MTLDPLDFFLTRKSTPVRLLADPPPDRATLERLLTAATRVPDHSKLEPWRLRIYGRDAAQTLAELTLTLAKAQGRDPDKAQKQASAFADAPMTVAVLSTPRPDTKIPLVEQQMSAGLVCLSLLNAAQVSGFAGNWLTGWMATDPAFLSRAFDLETPAMVAGFVHLGTPAGERAERPRPDLARIATWVDA
jgi:nitroreductase